MEVLPLPKSQLQEAGEPVERSWKFTTNGEQPERGEAVKLAAGACPKAKKLTQMVVTKRTKTFVRMVYMLFLSVLDLSG